MIRMPAWVSKPSSFRPTRTPAPAPHRRQCPPVSTTTSVPSSRCPPSAYERAASDPLWLEPGLARIRRAYAKGRHHDTSDPAKPRGVAVQRSRRDTETKVPYASEPTSSSGARPAIATRPGTSRTPQTSKSAITVPSAPPGGDRGAHAPAICVPRRPAPASMAASARSGSGPVPVTKPPRGQRGSPRLLGIDGQPGVRASHTRVRPVRPARHPQRPSSRRERLAASELEHLLILLQRFTEHNHDHWVNWRFDTRHWPMFVHLTRRPQRGVPAEAFTLLTKREPVRTGRFGHARDAAATESREDMLRVIAQMPRNAARFLTDLDGCYASRREQPPAQPYWSLFATNLITATVCE